LQAIIGLLPFGLCAAYVIMAIAKLRRQITGRDLETSVQTVKSAAKYVPVWITIVAWSTLWATVVLFYFR